MDVRIGGLGERRMNRVALPRGRQAVRRRAHQRVTEPPATTVNEGAAIANVELDANGQRLVASITVEAARELGLQEGKQVTAVIKASDLILATAD